MKVKDLVKIMSSASFAKVYFGDGETENKAYEYGEGPCDRGFAILREFAEEFGECEVLSIYPADIDFLKVLIKKEGE